MGNSSVAERMLNPVSPSLALASADSELCRTDLATAELHLVVAGLECRTISYDLSEAIAAAISESAPRYMGALASIASRRVAVTSLADPVETSPQCMAELLAGAEEFSVLFLGSAYFISSCASAYDTTWPEILRGAKLSRYKASEEGGSDVDTGIRVPRPILTMLLLWCSLSAIAVVVLGARVCGTISVGDPFVLFLCAYG